MTLKCHQVLSLVRKWHCNVTKYCLFPEKWCCPNNSATKSDIATSPNTALATKSDIEMSPNTAPFLKSDAAMLPNSAPATKSDIKMSPMRMVRKWHCHAAGLLAFQFSPTPTTTNVAATTATAAAAAAAATIMATTSRNPFSGVDREKSANYSLEI